jgi:FAD/FMN-containing dehydrogenase
MAITAKTTDGRSVTIDEDKLQALQGRLRFPLIKPGEPGFEPACLIWNGMITHRPALVAQPAGVADVVACIEFAREHGLPISPKGGGHNIAGTALPAGGLLLDMSRMRGVLVDPASRVVRVQAGCLLGDVDRETQVHGLAAVLGFVSETGVAGLTLGGGFGYLTRKYGYTVDSLLGVEIVTADGRVRYASLKEEEELFWALRGGGGNFGIATSFTFKVYEVGPKITGGMIVWDGAQAEEVLAFVREFTSKTPRELTCAATMRLAPPAPFVPKEYHGKPIVGVVCCHTGSLEQARSDLAPLKGLGKPVADLIVEKPYVEQQRMLDATQPKGPCYYWKSEYVSELSEGFLSAFRARAALNSSPMSQIIAFQLAGAMGERPSDDGAVGNRDAGFVCGVAGSWVPNDPNGPKYQQWVRESWEAIRPFSTGGVYVNFQTADEGEDRVRAAYGSNFDRLAAIKKKYDPNNLFRTNRNIAPA